MNAIDQIRKALQKVPPPQLQVALEVVASMYVTGYMDHHPLPYGTTAEELRELIDILIGQTITTAVNGAAKIIMEVHAQETKQANAADIAQAAIAKAAGKLN